MRVGNTNLVGTSPVNTALSTQLDRARRATVLAQIQQVQIGLRMITHDLRTQGLLDENAIRTLAIRNSELQNTLQAISRQLEPPPPFTQSPIGPAAYELQPQVIQSQLRSINEQLSLLQAGLRAPIIPTTSSMNGLTRPDSFTRGRPNQPPLLRDGVNVAGGPPGYLALYQGRPAALLVRNPTAQTGHWALVPPQPQQQQRQQPVVPDAAIDEIRRAILGDGAERANADRQRNRDAARRYRERHPDRARHRANRPERNPQVPFWRQLLPALPQLWLLGRLLSFAFLFTMNSSWRHTMLFVGLAFVYVAGRAGYLNFIERRWAPIRAHIERIVLPPTHPPQNAAPNANLQDAAQPVNAEEGGNNAVQQVRSDPNPADLARRLVEQQAAQRDAAPWRRILEEIERSFVIFLASIIPGLHERRIREMERALIEPEGQPVEQVADETTAPDPPAAVVPLVEDDIDNAQAPREHPPTQDPMNTPNTPAYEVLEGPSEGANTQQQASRTPSLINPGYDIVARDRSDGESLSTATHDATIERNRVLDSPRWVQVRDQFNRDHQTELDRIREEQAAAANQSSAMSGGSSYPINSSSLDHNAVVAARDRGESSGVAMRDTEVTGENSELSRLRYRAAQPETEQEE
jgi:hypothetical protein